MASILTEAATSAAQAAHSFTTSLLSAAQIEPGQTIPVLPVKEDAPDSPSPFNLKGRNIIIGVPGAFTGTCSAQIPKYIEAYDKFKEKGVKDIYVVAVNDAFVTKAWKSNLAPNGTGIHFIADDKGAFTSSVGLLFNASELLGSPRSKRYVIIADDHTVIAIAVEDDPGMVTVTAADTILAALS